MAMTDHMQDREDQIANETVIAIIHAGLWGAAMTALGMLTALIVIAGK